MLYQFRIRVLFDIPSQRKLSFTRRRLYVSMHFSYYLRKLAGIYPIDFKNVGVSLGKRCAGRWLAPNLNFGSVQYSLGFDICIVTI